MIVGNAPSDIVEGPSPYTGNQKIFLQYVVTQASASSAASGRLNVMFNSAQATPAYSTSLTPDALKAVLQSSIGYIGLQTTMDT